MDVKGAIKQEDHDTSIFEQLYTMPELPQYPDFSKSEESPFGNWSFSNASRGTTFRSPLQFSSTVDPTLSGDHEARSTLALDHDNLISPLSSTSTFSSVPPRMHRSHIPRPPNAFMLYRSDFLKRGVIPSHVERRQQNLSRIVGQCWNLLSPQEKAPWQDRAAQVLEEHQRKNPDYKFTPAPRGSRRSKMKGGFEHNDEAVDGEERIRQIREEYAHITGPAAPPARRRGPRQKRNRDIKKMSARKSPSFEVPQIPLPPSIPPSPSPSVSSPDIEYRRETPLPPFFPHHTFPHVIHPRRPSTSLGFATCSTINDTPSIRTGLALARPSSAASDTRLVTHMKDLDITPTVPTFSYISAPGSPASSMQTSPVQEFAYPTLNTLSPLSSSSYPMENLSGHVYPDPGSFLHSLYSDDTFAYNLPIVPAEQEFASLHETYETYLNYDISLNNTWEPDASLSLSGHIRSFTM